MSDDHAVTQLDPDKIAHQQSASFVKNVHANLRSKLHQSKNVDEMWENHLKDEVTLSKYSDAMVDLAINHWPKKGSTRIDWCRDIILLYYFQGGLQKLLEKDNRREKYNNSQNLTVNSNEITTELEYVFESPVKEGEKITLLDVGSCYNPFKKYDDFFTIALDICPADKSVYLCDFLNINITDSIEPGQKSLENYFEQFNSHIVCLPKQSFHVVVCSLLIEYLPSKHQRLLCCKNAYNVLMNNGLLVIISPDSGHVGKNARQMKSWKLAMSQLGFHRWRYVKQEHLHCMAFRKIESQLQTDDVDLENLIYIPQDNAFKT